ncbi:potassium voltage-gated channel protein eag-like [Bolinopsis microptera]|uniref:potassium voltage-gated channel protein eag-like n=1 Tax=Bolinopsis microptera TaxID=2820187 RepID=UPI0030796369
MEAYLTDLISTNTYARRVTKHHSYDYENNLVNLDIEKSLKATELQNVDHSYNENLEKMLTTIHGISQMFMLVNVTIPSFPVVFVSNEFTTFYRYSRNDVYLKDARLAFMMGPCTRKGILREIKHTLEASNENTLDYVLYTKDGIPVPTTIGLLRVKKPDHHNNDSYFAMTFDPFKSKDGPVEGEKDPEKELNVWLGEKSLVAPILKNKDKVLYTKHKSFKRKIFQRFTQLFESVNLLADSTIRKTWDWFILLASIWATFSVPVQVCFDEKIYYSKDIDLITDILFLIDMVMNFRTTFVNADGLVILTSKKMATHYLKGWFIVDLLTAVPWQFLQLIKPAKAFRYLKLTRVLRMAKVAFHLDEYTKNGPISLILIIMYFIMLGHLIACGWFWLGRSDYESNIAGWVTYHLQNNHFVLTPDIVGEQDLQEDFYSASLYFVMTIFCTVGFGNIAPWNVSEQIFCVIVMLIGAFFYAIIFGSATNIIMRMGAQQSRFLDQQKDLDLYTSVNKFPLDLKNRMEDYFYYHWFNSKGIEHSQMMQDWPRTLKEDTSLFLHRILFAEWPVFNEASTGCRRSLSSLVERHGFTPGDYIVHEEDCVDAVYFLVRGHVKILKDGDVIGILTMGDTFGEKWWPTAASGKANADIQAMTYAEIEVLTHERLKDILVKFPDYWSMWEQKLDITYELANRADQNIFDNLPADLKIYVASERTPVYQGDQQEFKEGDMGDEELLKNTQDTINRLTKLMQG